VGPHTADAVIEAWGPTAGACLEEAVAAFVGIFADFRGADAGEERAFQVGPGSPEVLVVLLLEEVLVDVEVRGVVACAARVEIEEDGRLAGTLTTVPVDGVEVVGPLPKGVSYHGLTFGPEDGTWRCRATVDV
jgi:SHS2 domain-containing protein